MLAYFQRRLLHAVVVFLVVSTFTFILVRQAPGLPQIMTGDMLTNEDRMQFRENLGLDRPIYEQYFVWWSHMLRGDFGISWSERTPVLDAIVERFPNTLMLAAAAMALSVLVGVPAGVLSAVKRYSVADHTVSTASLIGLAIPNFWLALLLILTFSVHWQILPSAGMYPIGRPPTIGDRIEHLIMPTIVLAVGTLAQLVRYTRSSMLEVLGLDFVRTARAKGLSEAVVLNRHALRNALIPVITVIGLQVPRFIGGSVIVETIFAWPGIGRLAYSATLTRDYPLIMGVTVIISIVVLISNLLTDLAYSLVNPRIRLQ
jgi:peptide/nickel transport system permease protein